MFVIILLFNFLLIHRQKPFTLTLLFHSDVVIHLFVYTVSAYYSGIGVAFPQWPMTILCITYILRYTGIPVSC